MRQLTCEHLDGVHWDWIRVDLADGVNSAPLPSIKALQPERSSSVYAHGLKTGRYTRISWS